MLQASHQLKRLIVGFGDTIIFLLCLILTLLGRYHNLEYGILAVHIAPFAILWLSWLAVFYITGLYDLRLIQSPFKLFRTYVEAMFINLAFAIAFFYLIPFFGIAPRTNLLVFFLLTLTLDYGWRLVFHQILLKHFQRPRILFVGDMRDAQEIQTLLSSSAYAADLVAVLSKTPSLENTLLPHVARAYGWDQFERIVQEHHIHIVILASHISEDATLTPHLYRSLFAHLSILDRAELEEIVTGRIPLSYVSQAWFLRHLPTSDRDAYETIKRGLDLLLAIPISLFAIMIAPLMMIAIKVASPGGPILIRQTRIGKLGKPFTLIKYRTMQPLGPNKTGEAEGPQFTASVKDDPRLFPLGRILRQLRLDELPQLWNIWRGDLSFIGPRPERPEFVTPLIERMPYYALRHLVRPGLTGWAQVVYLTPVAQLEDNLIKLQYDLYYVKNRSFMIDVAILLKTIGIVLKRQGT